MSVVEKSEFKGKFRYNGADLSLMKKVVMTDDPHKAVEYFIERAIRDGKTPEQLLEEAKKESSNG